VRRILDLNLLVKGGFKYSTIYVDPPWKYGNQSTRSATDRHYNTMTLEEISELPVEELSNKDSFLHLWTTNAFLFSAERLIKAWGYEYKSVFVWVKTQMGIGNYWRVSHEFLLTAKRGNPKWKNKSLMSWGEFPRTKHSRKPMEVRRYIESACSGPRLELFGRELHKNWDVWGDEIDVGLFDGG
jgi:N6-adenosine-specific RNA methylase IME4